MKLAGHAVLKAKTIKAYRILIRTPEKKNHGCVGAQYKKYV